MHYPCFPFLMRSLSILCLCCRRSICRVGVTKASDRIETRMAGEGAIGLALFLRQGVAPQLERLVLSGCNMGAKELRHLSYVIQDGCCKSMQFLDLSSNSIKREGVTLIRRMFCKQFLPNLRVLDLSDNSLGDQGIGEFGNGFDLDCMAQVKALDLSRNHITDEGASIIYLYIRNHQWKRIEHLYLDCRAERNDQE